MNKILFAALMTFSIHAFPAPMWASAKINLVFGGFPDNSITFMPIGGALNPANCTDSSVYAIQPDHDTKSALSILLAAKMSDRTVYFSVRDDVCHTVQQIGVSGLTVPVIQRIAID